MNYSFDIEIEVPCAVMIDLLEDPANLHNWQPELASHELLSGTPRQVGARSRLSYHMNGRPMDIIQEITVRDLPDELSSRSTVSGMNINVTNRFADIGPESTLWRHETEIEFTSFVTKLVGYFMPHVFRNQTWRYINLFKRFAEQTYQAKNA